MNKTENELDQETINKISKELNQVLYNIWCNLRDERSILNKKIIKRKLIIKSLITVYKVGKRKTRNRSLAYLSRMLKNKQCKKRKYVCTIMLDRIK